MKAMQGKMQVLVIGGSGVGKTSIINRLYNNSFSYSPKIEIGKLTII